MNVEFPRASALLLAASSVLLPLPGARGQTTQQAYVKASNTQESDGFGVSVAISGDTVIVGASSEDSGATGVNGDQNHNGYFGAGAAYVFELDFTPPGVIQLEYRKSNAAGVSGTTIPIGALGGVSPGDTKRYQCWYRDNSGAQPCGVGVNDFNLSNGYEITWLP